MSIHCLRLKKFLKRVHKLEFLFFYSTAIDQIGNFQGDKDKKAQ